MYTRPFSWLLNLYAFFKKSNINLIYTYLEDGRQNKTGFPNFLGLSRSNFSKKKNPNLI